MKTSLAVLIVAVVVVGVWLNTDPSPREPNDSMASSQLNTAVVLGTPVVLPQSLLDASRQSLSQEEPAEGILVQDEPNNDTDPCSEVRLEAEALRARVFELERECRILRYPEESPFGFFLRTYEAEGMSASDLRHLELILDDIPVFLRPGEATWIIERDHNGDWPAGTVTESIIGFLGPERVLSEAPPAAVHELYCDELWESLYGVKPR